MIDRPRTGRRAPTLAAPAPVRVPRDSGRPDQGQTTVELAVSLPALVLLVVVGLAAIGAMRTQLECVDAAREAARAAARGGPAPPAPAGATVTVAAEGDLVRATVHTHVKPLGGRLPGFDVVATAVAAMEPGAGS